MPDKHGYPTAKELKRIEQWKWDDPKGLLEYIQEELWSVDYGYIRAPEEEKYSGCTELITHGWSGNESIINALARNKLVMALCWQLSERGGRYIFDFRPIPTQGKEQQ